MTGKILHKVVGASHVLKPVGDVRVTQGPSLNRFLGQLAETDILKAVVVDLSEARALDSTALGFLARIAITTESQFGFKPTLLFGHEDIHRVLDSMGFEQIFLILQSQRTDEVEMAELVAEQFSETALRSQVLEAHKTLMDLNHRNHDQFCDLVTALESECLAEPVKEHPAKDCVA